MENNYTITLADGQKIENLGLNGNNFVSTAKIDESIFEDNLSTMTVSDGETETVYHDVEFIQQMQWSDGTYYLAFRELSEQEKTMKSIQESLSDSDSSVTDLQVALTEIYEMMLGGM